MNENLNKSEQFIVREVDNSHAIWFQKSKSFLLLEEPAFEVFHQFSNNEDKDKIVEICQQKYGHLEKNIPKFVEEIIEHIQYYNDPENTITISKNTNLSESIRANSFLPAVNYILGEKSIEVLYGNEDLKFAIHPLLAHLKTDHSGSKNHSIECFEHNNLLIVKYNGQIIDAIDPEDIGYFTGAVRQLMYSILYDRENNSWMTMLHASGIVANNEAILFSAASGSGKSTISAILKAEGYGYLSDDFIATDNNGKAYAFPAAISVKEGSVSTLLKYYPELENTSTKKTFIGKTVRYIPVQNITSDLLKGIQVKAFVFVSYSSADEFIFEKVEKKKALELLLMETWVNPTPETVSCFFDWVEKTEFYRLHYSKTEEALGVVRKIFSH